MTGQVPEQAEMKRKRVVPWFEEPFFLKNVLKIKSLNSSNEKVVFCNFVIFIINILYMI